MRAMTGIAVGVGVLLAGIILWWAGSGPSADRRPSPPTVRLPQPSEIGMVLPEAPPRPAPPAAVRPTPPTPSPSSEQLSPPPAAVRELNDEGAIAY